MSDQSGKKDKADDPPAQSPNTGLRNGKPGCASLCIMALQECRESTLSAGKICRIQHRRGPKVEPVAGCRRSKDPDAVVVWQDYLLHTFRQVKIIREKIAGYVWLVSFGPGTVCADPGDLITLDETSTNLIDSRDNTVGGIIIDNQIPPRGNRKHAELFPRRQTTGSTG